MARQPRGGKAPQPDDRRRDFKLDEQRAESLRAAVDSEAGVGEEDPTVVFWRRMGSEMGFDPESIVLVSMPETGEVEFTAIANETEAQPPAASEPAAAGDDDDEDEGLDAESAHNAGLAQMEAVVDEIDLASSTLVGDLTAGLVEIVKRLQKPWDAHSQHEKRDLEAKLEHLSQQLARKSVDVVAADDRITVKAILDKITIGDKVQINLTLGAMSDDDKADAVAQLFHAQKKSVLIVTADADRHMGKRREVIPPDEEELPFDAGKDSPKGDAQQAGDEAAQAALDQGASADEAQEVGGAVEEGTAADAA